MGLPFEVDKKQKQSPNTSRRSVIKYKNIAKNIKDKKDSKIIIDNQLNTLKKLSYIAIKTIS